MIGIAIFKNPEEAFQQASKKLSELICSAEGRVLLLCSGGSAFSILNIADEAYEKVDAVSMLDERFSGEKEVNNFLALSETDFYKKAVSKEVKFFETIPQEGESLEKFSGRFEDFLKDWLKSHPEGRIVTTMGVGKDAHTAGIFPKESAEEFRKLFESKTFTAFHTDRGALGCSDRITVTNYFLRNHVDSAVLIVTGKEKGEALEKLNRFTGEIHNAPVRVAREMKEVFIFASI